jgi:GTP-binding protein
LGVRFLGHLERCAALIHLVDATSEDVVGAWRTVRAELAAYGAGLAEKPEILALNKIDALDAAQRRAAAAALKKVAKVAPLQVSAVTGEGVTPLLRAAYGKVATRAPKPGGVSTDGDWRP